ncbi:hypothetical protein IEQ34_002523 [Dendrobium chrysotoxum]|uniref:Uncharacterized protein n=1 Tax=Dendrobium chrysotoxum TaxID=161865 RepID=A0AAV7HJT7_DENCH|nr:hypothetical protein IEQ34_002523 [Dendrobium chrysotoxum]
MTGPQKRISRLVTSYGQWWLMVLCFVQTCVGTFLSLGWKRGELKNLWIKGQPDMIFRMSRGTSCKSSNTLPSVHQNTKDKN